MNEHAILRLDEVAQYLRVSRATIYRLLKRGELPAFRVGGGYRFRIAEIDAWREGQPTALDEMRREELAAALHRRTNGRGQTYTEFAVLIAAVAIVAFVGYEAVGNGITVLGAGLNNALTNA